MPGMRRIRTGGFSIIELMVVIGIIAVLLGLLFPTLHKARAAAKSVVCQSNMRQIGVAMAAYAGENDGWLFPPDEGTPNRLAPIDRRWFQIVLKTKPPLNPASTDVRDWTPAIMLCPSDDPEPAEYHSYIVNAHLVEKKIRYFTKNLGGRTSSEVVIMGEKVTTENDYYMETESAGQSDFDRVVEKYRHGLRLGSNYLFLDLHVGTLLPKQARDAIDPWDVVVPQQPGG